MATLSSLCIDNRGYYSLKEFHLSTVFSDAEGAEISRANTLIPVIPHGEDITIIHNVTLSPTSLLEKGEQYLFNDNDLNVSVTAGLNFAELLPAEISMGRTLLQFHSRRTIIKPSYPHTSHGNVSDEF